LFKLNNFKGCARFFKWIDDVSSREGYSLDMFPMEMRVRLAYYRGRYHLYNNEFPQSRMFLKFAFENCHKEYKKNKRMILKYLIPVEMNFFNFPSKVLLDKYEL
jgi:hypothetical protein